MKLSLLDRLLASGGNGKRTALATHLGTGAQLLVTNDSLEGELVLHSEEILEIRRELDAERDTVVSSASGDVFVEIWRMPRRLFLVGGAHVAQAIAEFALLAGYDVTLIDPRTAFASAERFPNVTITHDWPDDVLGDLKPDRSTAIVTVSHDPKIDDPALCAALQSEAFYIGALGSRYSHAKRCERLIEYGVTQSALRRIRGPVGLAIGAVTPAEIAISVLADMTAVFHKAALAADPGWNRQKA